MMDLVYEMRDHGKASTEDLAAHPGRHLACCRGGYSMTKVFDKVGPAHVVLVWSMWSGYWTREGCAMREWAEARGVEPKFVHSGGHACPDDLRRLVDAIAAKQTVWVHTDCEDPAGEVSGKAVAR